MRNNVCLKSTLRQPVRTLCLLLLCAAASFAFLSQALQAVVVDRATEEISGYYRSIGALVKQVPDPDARDVSDLLPLLEESPYMDFVDSRRILDFTMKDVYVADTETYNQASSYLYVTGAAFAAEITEDRYTGIHQGGFNRQWSLDWTADYDYAYRLRFSLRDVELLQGLPEYDPGSDLTVTLFGNDWSLLQDILRQLTDAPRVLLRLRADKTFRLSYYLEPLNTMGWVTDETTGVGQFRYPSPESEPLYIWSLEAGESPDFSDPALAEVRAQMELLDVNLRTAQLWTTQDMTAIPDFDRTYALTEGRLLTHEDELAQNPVCVIRSELARVRGLSLGDTLTVTLRKLDHRSQGGCIRPDMLDTPWQEAETTTLDLTIVGMVTVIDSASGYQYPNYYSDIFAPDWVAPDGYGWDGQWASDMLTSFVLKDIRDQKAFIESMEPALDRAGYSLRFQENGWDSFYAAAQPMGQSARTSALLFGIVLLLALLLASVLYGFCRRKDLAILRVLGLRKRRVLIQAMGPLAAMGLLSIGLGGWLAYDYGMEKAREAFAALEAEAALTPRFSPWELAALAGLALLILLLSGLAVLAAILRSPVLEQLQGGKRQARERAVAQAVLETYGAAAPRTGAPAPTPTPHRRAGRAWCFRWVGRRVFRQGGRSLLALTLAVTLILGMGYLRTGIENGQAKIDGLYDSIQVTGQVARTESASYVSGGGYLPHGDAEQLEALGFLTSTVREIGFEVDAYTGFHSVKPIPGKDLPNSEQEIRNLCCQVRGIEDPATFPPLQDGTMVISYGEGMDEARFFSHQSARDEVLVQEDALAKLGLQVGDTVTLVWASYAGDFRVVGSYTGLDQELVMSFPMIETLYETLEAQGERPYCYSRYEFATDVSKNRALPQFRAEAEEILSRSAASSLLLLLRDGELTQAVEPLERNLKLLKILYPVMRLLSVVLAAGLASLLVMQTARETAILRVLGVRKGRAAGLLTAEQLVLAVMGVLLGAILTMVLGFTPLDWQANALLYILGCLTGAAVCAGIRVQKNPLALLQVKE